MQTTICNIQENYAGCTLEEVLDRVETCSAPNGTCLQYHFGMDLALEQQFSMQSNACCEFVDDYFALNLEEREWLVKRTVQSNSEYLLHFEASKCSNHRGIIYKQECNALKILQYLQTQYPIQMDTNASNVQDAIKSWQPLATLHTTRYEYTIANRKDMTVYLDSIQFRAGLYCFVGTVQLLHKNTTTEMQCNNGIPKEICQAMHLDIAARSVMESFLDFEEAELYAKMANKHHAEDTFFNEPLFEVHQEILPHEHMFDSTRIGSSLDFYLAALAANAANE